MEKIFKTYKAEIKNIDVENHIVSAIVSTENPDRDNEVILADAMEKGLESYRQHPILLANHDWRDLRKNIGSAKDFKFEGGNTTVDFQYLVGKGNAEADWAFELAKEGLAAYSIGFIPQKWEQIEDSKANRACTALELLEISQVVIPSNREALQIRSKTADVESELCKEATLNEEFMTHLTDKKKDMGKASENESRNATSEIKSIQTTTEAKIIGMFSVSGDTDVTNEHFHLFDFDMDKNGVVVGKTWETINEGDTEPIWHDTHVHLITNRAKVNETNEHAHDILLFKGLEELGKEVIQNEQENVISDDNIEEKQSALGMSSDIFNDNDIIDAVLRLNLEGKKDA